MMRVDGYIRKYVCCHILFKGLSKSPSQTSGTRGDQAKDSTSILFFQGIRSNSCDFCIKFIDAA
jgi:hypothetical protein